MIRNVAKCLTKEFKIGYASEANVKSSFNADRTNSHHRKKRAVNICS